MWLCDTKITKIEAFRKHGCISGLPQRNHHALHVGIYLPKNTVVTSSLLKEIESESEPKQTGTINAGKILIQYTHYYPNMTLIELARKFDKTVEYILEQIWKGKSV